MKWPEIPENLDGLTSVEVRALAAQVARALAAAPLKMSDEEQTEWEDYRQLGVNLNARANSLAEAEAHDAEVAEREAAEQAAAETTETETQETETQASTETEETEEEEEEVETEHSTINTTLSVETTRETIQISPRWQATGAVSGVSRGEGFASQLELAEAVMDAARSMSSGASCRGR